MTLALSALWWAGVNIADAAGASVPWNLLEPVAHGLVMSLGFVPLFVTGFVFTAGPRWLALPAPAAVRLRNAVVCQVGGWVVFIVGCHVGGPVAGRTAAALGLAAATAGWAGVVLRHARMIGRSQAADRMHSTLIVAACAFGVVCLGMATLGVALGPIGLARASVRAGLWIFIGVVFMTASHRMIPFYSAASLPALEARHPLWLLGAFVALFVFEGIASFAEGLGAFGGTPWRLARGGVELLGGATVVVLAARWSRVQSPRFRVPAMLQIGFAWLGLSLLMAGVARCLDPAYGDATPAGLAATHAYTMGFVGSTMFTMVSRVSSAHAGRAVAVDDFVWSLFWVLQLAVVTRLAGAWLLVAAPAAGRASIVAAAALWAAVCLAWALRYGNWFGRPRPDGRPG